MKTETKPFSYKINRRYEGSKQIVIYVDSRIYEKLSTMYPGASNAVLVGTIMEAVLGQDFTNQHSQNWPRNAVPWRVWRQSHQHPVDGPKKRHAEPRPASAQATTRRGRISLAAWFPAEIVDDALTVARSGATKYSKIGRTLHRVLVNCAADLTGVPLISYRDVVTTPLPPLKKLTGRKASTKVTAKATAKKKSPEPKAAAKKKINA
jgi:hypothetical protein